MPVHGQVLGSVVVVVDEVVVSLGALVVVTVDDVVVDVTPGPSKIAV